MKVNFLNSVFALPFVVLLCWFSLLHDDSLGQFPGSEFSSEIAGELSLIQGYVDNGFNFFSPTSLKLNVKEGNISGITAAHFPLIPYLSSFLVYGGVDEVVAYQSVGFVFSVAGIVFFLLLCHLIVPSRKWVVIAGVLFASTPAVLHFFHLPVSVFPAFSLFLGAVYFGSRYVFQKGVSNLYLLLVFALFATMMRPVYTWFLLLLFCWMWYTVLKEKHSQRQLLLTIGLWFVSYVGYIVSYELMAAAYGSVFYDFFNWNWNIGHFIDVFSAVFSRSTMLFTLLHSAFIVLGIGLVFAVGKQNRPIALHSFYVFALACYVVLPFIWLVATTEYVQSGILYYDVMLLPFALVMIIAVKGLSGLSIRYYIELTIGVVALLILINYNALSTLKTETKNIESSVAVKNFNELQHLVAEAGVKSEDKILVLGSKETMVPLFLMRQKGYSIHDPSAFTTQDIIDLPADYIAINQSFFIEQVVQPFPEIINHLEVVWSNDFVTLCRKRKQPKNILLTEYYAEFRNDRLRALRTLDATLPQTFNFWEKINTIAEDSSFFVVPKEREFGPTFTAAAGHLGIEDGYEMVLQGDFSFKDHTKKTAIVVSISTQQGDGYFYRELPVTDPKCAQKGEMCTVFGAWKLPDQIAPDDVIKVYIWNDGRQEIKCNNISFVIYGPPL